MAYRVSFKEIDTARQAYHGLVGYYRTRGLDADLANIKRNGSSLTLRDESLLQTLEGIVAKLHIKERHKRHEIEQIAE